MDKNLLKEISENALGFENKMRGLKSKYKLKNLFKEEARGVASYLDGLGFQENLIESVLKHLLHHDFEKLFLIYNSYLFFNKKGGMFPHRIFILGEMVTIPIIFMDDVLDSHTERNMKKTPFGHFAENFPRYKKEAGLFLANILSNYFFAKALSFDEIEREVRIGLLNEAAESLNKTIFGGLFEQELIPKSISEVMEIYRIKSYYFTTYLLSSWGALLARKNIREDKEFEKLILNITYLTQMNNDLKDFVMSDGKKRFEDVMNYSNSLMLYFLYKSKGGGKAVKDIIEEKKYSELYSLNNYPIKKEVLKTALDLREECSNVLEGFLHQNKNKDACKNYKNYIDRLINDILSKLRGI